MREEANEKELKKLRAITSIHYSIGALLELTEIARIVVRELINIVNCDGCAILLIEDDKVKILAEKGFSQTFGEISFSSDTPAIKHVVTTKQAIFTGDILASSAASCVPRGCQMNSLICAPIIVSNQVKGIIHLDASRKNAFAKEDLTLVELLAKEASIAMERSFLYAQVRDTSVRDGLTGCYNRRKFDVDIAAEIAEAKQQGKPLSFLMIDIDWFKKYNDFHGHPKGDILLQKIVNILTFSIRPLDKIYRYGGEEFAILLPETDKAGALVVATRLLKAVQNKGFEGERASQPAKKITISIGVASFPSDAKRDNELIEAADSALYKAKQSGRNQVCVF